jgi:hypothetical protein
MPDARYDAEIDYFRHWHAVMQGHHDVRRLDVAVYDAILVRMSYRMKVDRGISKRVPITPKCFNLVGRVKPHSGGTDFRRMII